MKTIEAETELKQFAENYSDWLVVIGQSNRTLTEEGEDIFYVAPGTEIVWPECDVDDCPPGLIEAIRKLSKMRKKPFDPESQEMLLRNLRQRAPLRPEDLKKLPKADLEWLERSGQVKVVSVKDGEKVYERTVKEGTSWVWPLDGYQSPECLEIFAALVRGDQVLEEEIRGEKVYTVLRKMQWQDTRNRPRTTRIKTRQGASNVASLPS